MGITPDFSEMQELESSPLPAGTWKSRLTKMEQKVSTKGNPMLKVQFTIFDCAGDLAKYNNWKISSQFMLSGKGTFSLKQFMDAADLAPGFEIEDALGKEVLVSTKPGKNQDGSPSDFPEIKAIQKLQ